MLGRKVIYVRCINCSYNNVAKGIRLVDKKAILVFTGKISCKLDLLKKYIPLRHSIFYMYPTNSVSQIFSLSIRRTKYKCTLMYVYRIIAPKYTSKPPPPFRTSIHIKDCQFRYWGQQNTLMTSSMPTKTFNMFCKPTNLQYVPLTPIRH